MSDHDPANIFMAQIKGFYAGAGVKPYDPRFEDAAQAPQYIREAYARGFADGIKARCEYAKTLSEQTGYWPSPLRAQTTTKGE